MKTTFIASFLLSASVAMLLAGCIKMPKADKPEPEPPVVPDPDFPPPARHTSTRMAMNPVR